MGDLIRTVLGSAGIVTLLIASVGGVVKLYQSRSSNRRLDERDANEQLGEFRAAAEAHILGYDVPMRERVIQHEALINQLRQGQGKEPIPFPPLPQAAPLFPRRPDKD